MKKSLLKLIIVAVLLFVGLELFGSVEAKQTKPDSEPETTKSDLIAAVGCPTARFGEPLSTVLGDHAISFDHADFDRDGNIDLIVHVRSSGDQLRLFRGDGDGTFQAATVISSDFFSDSSIASGDFNGDGKPDFIISAKDLNEVYLFSGNGDGTFVPGLPTSIVNPRGMRIADFNRDGKLDFATIRGALFSSGVQLGLGDGNGNFTLPQPVASAGFFLWELDAGDLNGDGFPDVAVSAATPSGNNPHMVVFYGDGQGSFFLAPIYPIVEFPSSVNIVDVNRDGRNDIVTTSGVTTTILTKDGPGIAGFTVTSHPIAGLKGAVGDFNSDGAPDIVGEGQFVFNVSLNDGNGSFDSPTVLPKDFSQDADIETVDLNSDGKLDLLSLNDNGALGNAAFRVRLNACNNLPCGNTNFGAPQTVTGNPTDNPSGFVSADFNGDGFLDAAVANTGSDNVAIFYGNAAGQLGTPAVFAPIADPVALSTGDFNRDGRPDVAVQSDSDPSNVGLLLSSSSPALFTAATASAGSGASGITVGDFDRDGNDDIVIPNAATSQLRFLSGNGNGTFDAAVSTASGSGFGPIIAKDFNRDGKLDLAVSQQSPVAVAVHLGLGNGQFSAPSNLPLPGLGRGLVSDDINRDGKADLVVAVTDVDSTYILLGDGAGGFSSAAGSPLTSVDSPRSVTIADFDSDDKPDLAIASRDTDSVAVLIGNGTGGFSSPSAFSVGDGPRSIVSGDFNRDGRTDWRTTNFTAGTITTRFNSCNVTPTVVAQNGLLVQQSYTLTDVRIGTGFDGDQSIDSLIPRVNGAATATVNGVTISSLTIDQNGIISANISASCGATNANFSLSVTDNQSVTASVPLTITVANDTLSLSYGNEPFAVVAGGNRTIFPLTIPTSAGSPVTPQVQSITPNGFTGQITTDVSGRLRIANASPAGTYTVAVAATNVCETATTNITIVVGATFCPTPQFSGESTLPTGTSPESVAVGDFNNDGFEDLLVANTGSNSVSRLLGNGSGGFGPKLDIAVGSRPQSVVTADFDRDGHVDAAVGNRDSNTISLLRGNGAGAFTASSFGAVAPNRMTVGDFNLDGYVDIAITQFSLNGISGRVQVFLNDTFGGFSAGTEHTVGGNPTGIVTSDFNLDGRPDLATADLFSHSVSVLLNNGTGFDASNLSSGFGAFDITVGDFDNDGSPDIATGNYGDGFSNPGSVTFHRGDGLGGFSAPATIASGSRFTGIAAADFDVDGRVDLVAVNYDTGQLMIFEGDGAGTFGAPISLAASFPFSVKTGDFNGDDKPDLVAAIGTGASVHLNSCGSQPAFTSPATALFLLNTAGSFTITTTGLPPVNSITRTGALPPGLTFVNNGDGTATISGTPTGVSGGTYNISLTGSNGVGPNASQNLQIIVTVPLAFTSINETRFIAGQQSGYTITTAGLPVPVIERIAGNLPPGVLFADNGNGTAGLSGVPVQGTGGVYTISLRARNNVGPDATQTFTLTIDEAPVITSPNQAGFLVGVPGSFQVTTIGHPTPITLSIVGPLPANVTFNPATGRFSGTPQAASLGEYPLMINAVNGVAPNGFQLFTLRVCTSTAVEVTNTNNSGAGSLRQAIIDACPGSTITFASGLTGQINVNGPLFIDKNLTIQGPGADSLSLRGQGDRILVVNSGNNVNVSGLTLTNGFTNFFGAAIVNNGNLTLGDSVVTAGQALQDGGAISNSGALKITGSTIHGNSAGRFGGAVHSVTGSLEMINTTISGNTSLLSGGGLYVAGTVRILNCTIINNRADLANNGISTGGGLFNSNAIGINPTTMQNTLVVNNFLRSAPAGPIPNEIDGNTFATGSFNFIGLNGYSLSVVVSSTLGSNGGKTPTHLVPLGSPLIDQGGPAETSFGMFAPLATDQRGFARTVDNNLVPNAPGGNGTDIGAVEAQIATAAGESLGGRVMTAAGAGIVNARVAVTLPSGEIRAARTNSFGYYRIDDLEAGETYVVNVKHKRAAFAPRIVVLNDAVEGIDFVAMSEF